jgi:hypothetical protein
MFDRNPDANIGVACGSPGPTVLDIDRPADAAFLLATLEADHPPEVMTARGRHLYYAGTDAGTVGLEFGELRGRGSYVVAPPSVHPDGSPYAWLTEPDGLALPAVPGAVMSLVASTNGGTGAGVMAPVERVAHGQRHAHLTKVAVHLVRGGMLDPRTLELALRAEYESVCDPDPPARPDEFAALAGWAVRSRIAGRERDRGHGLEADTPTSLLDHRRLVDEAGGWRPVTVAQVRRYGNRLVDALHVYLDNGTVLDFPRQGDITTRGHWRRTVISATDGEADPPPVKESQLEDLYRSLCVLAGKSRAQMEAETHADMLADLLGLCMPLTGHNAADMATRYRLVAAIRARPTWDPTDRNATTQPVLVVDDQSGDEYLRAGDVMAWFRHRGAGIHSREFPGRMSMIGLEHVRLSGREPAGLESGDRRATNTAVFYRLNRAAP